MHTRVTYRGVGLFANGEQLDRVQAFGSSGTINREDVFELSNQGIVGIVEESEEVQVTIDALEYGTVATLAKLAGDSTKKEIDLANDFEYAAVPIWNYIRPQVPGGDQKVLFTEFIEAASLTGFSANYTVDGNSTESYTLVGNGKFWILGDKPGVKLSNFLVEGPDEGEWDLPLTIEAEDVLAVYVNGRAMPFTTRKGEPDSVVVEGTKSGDKVRVAYKVKSDQMTLFTPNTKDAPTKRRGHIDLELVTNHSPFGKSTPWINMGTKTRIGVQSISIDASLDREAFYELGRHRYVDRPLNYPINITVSVDIMFKDLEMFARLCGKDVETADMLDLTSFRNDVGLIIAIYDDLDTAPTRKRVKEIHIPYLVPTDEAFNVSLDGNATQTFSFRTHMMGLKEV